MSFVMAYGLLRPYPSIPSSMIEKIVAHYILGIIPARFQSARFPGKALALLDGKPLIQHVYERAILSRYLSRVIVATDDERIAEAARSFKAPVRLTRPDHPSGTDRCAEVAASENADIIVNIQGDEPLIDPAAIDTAILAILDAPQIPMATLKKRIENPEELHNPNVVKVVTDLQGNAIYFSRFCIPYNREGNVPHFKHIGLYVYRREFLLKYPDLPRGPLEMAERLEQLRALENGYKIRVAETEYESHGVDTPEDLERVRQVLELESRTLLPGQKNYG